MSTIVRPVWEHFPGCVTETIENEHSYIIHGPQPEKISSFTTYDKDDYVRIHARTNINHLTPAYYWGARDFNYVFGTGEKWKDGRCISRRVIFGGYGNDDHKVLMIPDHVYLGVFREDGRIWDFMRHYDIHWVILSEDLTDVTIQSLRMGIPRLHDVKIQCPIDQMYLKDIVYIFKQYNESKTLVTLVQLQTLNLFPAQLPQELFLRLLCQLINRI